MQKIEMIAFGLSTLELTLTRFFSLLPLDGSSHNFSELNLHQLLPLHTNLSNTTTTFHQQH